MLSQGGKNMSHEESVKKRSIDLISRSYSGGYLLCRIGILHKVWVVFCIYKFYIEMYMSGLVCVPMHDYKV